MTTPTPPPIPSMTPIKEIFVVLGVIYYVDWSNKLTLSCQTQDDDEARRIATLLGDFHRKPVWEFRMDDRQAHLIWSPLKPSPEAERPE